MNITRHPQSYTLDLIETYTDCSLNLKLLSACIGNNVVEKWQMAMEPGGYFAYFYSDPECGEYSVQYYRMAPKDVRDLVASGMDEAEAHIFRYAQNFRAHNPDGLEPEIIEPWKMHYPLTQEQWDALADNEFPESYQQFIDILIDMGPQP